MGGKKWISLAIGLGLFLGVGRDGSVECEMPNLEDFGGDIPDFSNFNFGGGSLGSAPTGQTKAVDESELHLDDMTDSEEEQVVAKAERHDFQTEVTRLMDIIINSLYTHKHIFLRELISNAADALEKARYMSLKENREGEEWSVKIESDQAKKTVTVSDNGIGMTKEDLINNLGIIAKSGTSNFLEAFSQSEVNLIGQFGVGFYSAFLVADEVTVVSRVHEGTQYIWKSKADRSFTVVEDPRGSTFRHGTRIHLKLKEDSTMFANPATLKDYASKFSQFVAFPIYVRTEKVETVEEPIEGEEGKKKVEKRVAVWEQVNATKAIWLRPKDEVTPEEYHQFYKTLTRDYQNPLAWTHFVAEGEIEFRSILFMPARAPTDLFENYFAKPTSIKLYVRRVLVAEQIEDILPKYLNFVAGVVDSDDLPLNVSREELQDSKLMKVITKKLTKKSLEMIRGLMKATEKAIAEGEAEKSEEGEKKAPKVHDKYGQFYSQFGRNLKLGCYEDDENRSKIARLLKFYTSSSVSAQVTLESFVNGLGEEQKVIYYAAGEKADSIMNLPQIQYFLARGVPVLLLTEAMDEPCIQKLSVFEGRKFESIQKADVTLPEDEEEKIRKKKLEKKFEPLVKAIESDLRGSLMKVEMGHQLTSHPCAVVSSKYGYSAYMERVMKTQTFADPLNTRMMMSQRILQINPRHPIIQEMLAAAQENRYDEIKRDVRLMFDTAMLVSGFDVADPTQMASALEELVAAKLNVKGKELGDVDVSDISLESKESEEGAEDDGESMGDELVGDELVGDEASDDGAAGEEAQEEAGEGAAEGAAHDEL